VARDPPPPSTDELTTDAITGRRLSHPRHPNLSKPRRVSNSSATITLAAPSAHHGGAGEILAQSGTRVRDERTHLTPGVLHATVGVLGLWSCGNQAEHGSRAGQRQPGALDRAVRHCLRVAAGISHAGLQHEDRQSTVAFPEGESLMIVLNVRPIHGCPSA